MRSASLGALLASKLKPRMIKRLDLDCRDGARARLLELGDRLVMIAHACQDHAELKCTLGVFGMQLGAAAKRLNLILVEHFGQLVELALAAVSSGC